MNFRTILAVVAVTVTWIVMDMLIHGVFLMSTYEETAELWRPEGEMKMGLMWLVTLLVSVPFTLIYALLISPKSLKSGLVYGLLYGLATGISMGYGTYCFMPIPYKLAIGWFLGTLVEAVAAGALVGWVVKYGVGTSNAEEAP